MGTINGLTGVFQGRTLFQQRGEIGGAKSVFVKLQGQAKNDLVFPTYGGKVMNPPKGADKVFAGDLMWYKTDDNGVKPQIYLLRTFKVQATSESTATSYFLERDGYHHRPFVGDILMKAPSVIGGQGKAYKVTAVEATVNSGADVWKITVGTTLGTLTAGDILVEADKEHASTAKMLVEEINAVAPCDYDFLYEPASTANNTDFDNARYFLAPALGGLMYKAKMTYIPACVDAKNNCRVNGWFKVEL